MLCATASDRRIDWFRMIVDLERSGLTDNDIAKAIGVSRGAVRGWKAGSRPRHEEGEALRDLHRARTVAAALKPERVQKGGI